VALLIERFGLAILLLCALCVAPQPAVAGSLELQEAEVKAGLLYNFLKYVEPPQPLPSITVCIFGNDPFGGYLEPMAGRSVKQKEIALRTVHAVNDTQDCALVFVATEEKKQWPKLRNFLAGKPVMTVSDFDGFAASGGMIEFGRENDHIHVVLNMDAVDAAHLRVEDRLLKLVTIVHSGLPEGGR
jgi:hypothetical protein